MATPVGATTFYGDLKDLLPGKVKTYDGWATHNRGTRGDGWGPVHGVAIHHTVTKSTQSAVQMCWDGYSGLPGPLYPIVVDKTGAVHLVGWGRCNHAGTGDPAVLDHLIREELPFPKPRYAEGEAGGVDGNARLYGIAMLNMGDGEDPFPSAQLNSAATAAALLCAIHGWTERSVVGHKEWQRGKTDPSMGMGSFRTRVRNQRKRVDAYFKAR